MAWFKLIGGPHIENDPTGALDPLTKKIKEKEYRVGAEFESPKDLDTQFPGKFVRLADRPRRAAAATADLANPQLVLGTPVANPPVATAAPVNSPSNPGWNDDELHAMSVSELKQLAEADEIDLKGATKKDDIIKALRAGGLK